ncbi:MAG: hypothetical protein RLZZ188_1311 [Verrucomicrobiota bacterium]
MKFPFLDMAVSGPRGNPRGRSLGKPNVPVHAFAAAPALTFHA